MERNEFCFYRFIAMLFLFLYLPVHSYAMQEEEMEEINVQPSSPTLMKGKEPEPIKKTSLTVELGSHRAIDELSANKLYPPLTHKGAIERLQTELEFKSKWRYTLYGVAGVSLLLEYILQTAGAGGATHAFFSVLPPLCRFKGDGVYEGLDLGTSVAIFGLANIKYFCIACGPLGDEEEEHRKDYSFLRMLDRNPRASSYISIAFKEPKRMASFLWNSRKWKTFSEEAKK